VDLSGCQVQRETRFLSENIVLFNAHQRQRVTFRFPRTETPIVDRLAADLHARVQPDFRALTPTAPTRELAVAGQRDS